MLYKIRISLLLLFVLACTSEVQSKTYYHGESRWIDGPLKSVGYWKDQKRTGDWIYYFEKREPFISQILGKR